MNNENNNEVNPNGENGFAPVTLGAVMPNSESVSQIPVAPEAAGISPAPAVNVESLNQMPASEPVAQQTISSAPIINDGPKINEVASFSPAANEVAPAPNFAEAASAGVNNSAYAATPVNLEPMQNPAINDNLGFQTAPMSDTLEEPKPEFIVPEKESVGVIPPNKKNEKKSNKVAFIILMVALIIGIAYGLYYFLSNNLSNQNVTLSPATYSIFDEISTNIYDYATSENVDLSNCTIDLTDINNSMEGEYKYTITCEENEYSSTVTIIDDREYIALTNEVIFNRNDEYSIDMFISECSDSICTYSIPEEEEEILEQNLIDTGGPYEIFITVSDSTGREDIISATYYVVFAKFIATLPSIDSSLYNASIVTEDTLLFMIGNLYMDKGTRNYEYTFDSAEDYELAVSDYTENGSIENIEGEYTFNDSTYTIVIETDLTNDILDSEYGSDFPDDYSTINSFYKTLDSTIQIVQ